MKDFDVDIKTPPPSSKANNYINWHVHLSCAYFNSILILFFIAMQMQSAGGKAFGFTKSKAKLQPNKSLKITVDDLAGIDEAKVEHQHY